jgi:hypothetical protein
MSGEEIKNERKSFKNGHCSDENVTTFFPDRVVVGSPEWDIDSVGIGTIPSLESVISRSCLDSDSTGTS